MAEQRAFLSVCTAFMLLFHCCQSVLVWAKKGMTKLYWHKNLNDKSVRVLFCLKNIQSYLNTRYRNWCILKTELSGEMLNKEQELRFVHI